jgi:thiosulfate/3-mercaptopyruvate sulfurtransferase|tara:strand:- start:200 stop:1054 length:855 start_codon:yes stop_codon:yes gene_type:complete
MKDDPNTLVSAKWLKANIEDPNVRVLDASWHMPADERHAGNEFIREHISTARFFDIDDISDQRSTLPHMVPPIEKFMSRVRALGVGDGHQIVVYDSKGLFSAARVWWLFRLMGHNSVAVLDGGLPKWIADGNPTSTTAPTIRDRHMTVKQKPQMVRDVTQVAHAAKLHDHEIIDARSSGRFIGKAPEPRAGLRAGHIPSSKNLPFTKVLNTDHTMKTTSELIQVFTDAGIDLNKPAITTCGSGITAAVLSLALQRIGKTDHALYDGSWAEWGQFPTLDIATGDA